MRVCGILLGLAAIFAGSTLARAQVAMYGEATGGTLKFQETPHVYGGTFGFYDTKHHGPILIGWDLRGGVLERGSNKGPNTDTVLDQGQGGLRVALAPGILSQSLVPYAEVLTGLGYWRGGVSVTRQDAYHLLIQGVAGLDYRVTKKFDWRVAEFSYGRLGAQPGAIYPMMLSTGVVLRFQ
jgi:hypothetical protein